MRSTNRRPGTTLHVCLALPLAAAAFAAAAAGGCLSSETDADGGGSCVSGSEACSRYCGAKVECGAIRAEEQHACESDCAGSEVSEGLGHLLVACVEADGCDFFPGEQCLEDRLSRADLHCEGAFLEVCDDGCCRSISCRDWCAEDGMEYVTCQFSDRLGYETCSCT